MNPPFLGIDSGNVPVAYVTEETPRGAITIFSMLRKRMGLADTLTARSQMFHASLRSRLEARDVSIYVCMHMSASLIQWLAMRQ